MSGFGSPHRLRSRWRMRGSAIAGGSPWASRLRRARSAPSGSEASPGVGGSVVVVVCCRVVMEVRCDRSTTTSSAQCRVEVLYADLSTRLAASTSHTVRLSTMVPIRHHRHHAPTGRRFSTPSPGARPRLERGCTICTPVDAGRSRRRHGGASVAPPSPQTDGVQRLVTRCGKFSPAVTGRLRLNGAAKLAAPLMARRARKSRWHGSGKLPPPCSTC